MKVLRLIDPPSLKIRRVKGGLAQLARALAWHARGHRFDSVILHKRHHKVSFFLKQPTAIYNIQIKVGQAD
jgi:hypothetical protein